MPSHEASIRRWPERLRDPPAEPRRSHVSGFVLRGLAFLAAFELPCGVMGSNIWYRMVLRDDLGLAVTRRVLETIGLAARFLPRALMRLVVSVAVVVKLAGCQSSIHGLEWVEAARRGDVWFRASRSGARSAHPILART